MQYIRLMVLFFFFGTQCVNSQQAYVTAYYGGEAGSVYNCDGQRLRRGDCAVDFRDFPKDVTLMLGDNYIVRTADHGGTDVINRKAPHKHGLELPVIDVFFSSKREADEFALNGNVVSVREIQSEIVEFPSYSSNLPQRIIKHRKVKYPYQTR